MRAESAELPLNPVASEELNEAASSIEAIADGDFEHRKEI
jgi:hypothetical protein